VLAGVGGRTVAEAKERISKREFEEWLAYRRLHGSLNLGTRLEEAAALIAFTVHQSQGGRLDLEHFLPQRAIDEGQALAKAMESWR